MLELVLMGALLVWIGTKLGNWIADVHEREEAERANLQGPGGGTPPVV